MPLDGPCAFMWLCVHFPVMVKVPIWTLVLPAWHLYTSKFEVSFKLQWSYLLLENFWTVTKI